MGSGLTFGSAFDFIRQPIFDFVMVIIKIYLHVQIVVILQSYLQSATCNFPKKVEYFPSKLWGWKGANNGCNILLKVPEHFPQRHSKRSSSEKSTSLRLGDKNDWFFFRKHLPRRAGYSKSLSCTCSKPTDWESIAILSVKCSVITKRHFTNWRINRDMRRSRRGKNRWNLNLVLLTNVYGTRLKSRSCDWSPYFADSSPLVRTSLTHVGPFADRYPIVTSLNATCNEALYLQEVLIPIISCWTLWCGRADQMLVEFIDGS